VKRIVFGFILTSLVACSSAFLRYEKASQLKKNDEFEKAVRIERPVDPDAEEEAGTAEDASAPVAATETPATPANTAAPVNGAAPSATPSPEEAKLAAKIKKSNAAKETKKTEKKSSKKTKKGAEKVAEEPAAPTHRQPELEDDTGFNGRRPLVDPYREGEEVVHNMHYFKVSAGELKMKVGKMATVNGRKAYNFGISLKTSPVFSSFYSVDDKVETFVDFETLVPSVFQLHVKESAQLREARMFFDNHTNKATFWEKKVSKDKGEEEKKQAWDILPFSQNVYSAVFYMRNFKWDVGSQYAFRVADDEQNMVFKGTALRKEKLDTEMGIMNAVVIKPEMMLKGVFKPVGDIFIWLSDDEHHYILRIESKIKIGTIISEVISIKPGHN
jgi:hypothetical protein